MSKAAAYQIMAQKLNKPCSDCFGIRATLPISGANCWGLAHTRFPSLSPSLPVHLSPPFQMEQFTFRQCFPSRPSWCDTPFGLGVSGKEGDGVGWAGVYGDLCLPLCSKSLE